MNVNVRAGRENDSKEISILVQSLSKKYVMATWSEKSRKTLLDSMQAENFSNLIKSGCFYFVAEYEGVVVGVIGVKDHHHLNHLFVSEQFHGRGIARLLWNRLKEACLADGSQDDFTVNSSEYAEVIYKKLGFVAQSGVQEKNGVVFIPMKFELK